MEAQPIHDPLARFADTQARAQSEIVQRPGVLLCLSILFLPESPRFLVSHGKRAQFF